MLTKKVLIPDLWGESSDALGDAIGKVILVLIPDLWGESSDLLPPNHCTHLSVLIPDLWGESSDSSGVGSIGVVAS